MCYDLLLYIIIYYYDLKNHFGTPPGQPNLEQMTLTFYFADGGSGSPQRNDLMGATCSGCGSSNYHGDVKDVKRND
jgi:hypothetical protein